MYLLRGRHAPPAIPPASLKIAHVLLVCVCSRRFYVFVCTSGEGNGDPLEANKSMPISEGQGSSGSVGESGVGGDGALDGAAKGGGRDRTPTKGHYMKVICTMSSSNVMLT